MKYKKIINKIIKFIKKLFKKNNNKTNILFNNIVRLSKRNKITVYNGTRKVLVEVLKRHRLVYIITLDENMSVNKDLEKLFSQYK